MSVPTVRACALVLCLLALCAGPALAQATGRQDGARGAFWGEEDAAAQAVTSAPTEPIRNGFVILRGRYVPPPYVLRMEAGALLVNETAVTLRERPGGGMGMGGGGRDRGPGGILARAERGLREDWLLLDVEGAPAAMLPPDQAVPLLDVLLDRTSSKQSRIEALTSSDVTWLTSGQWAAIMDSFAPTDELRQRLEKVREQFFPADATGAIPRAPSRLGASLVALLSLLLTTGALAVVLTHVPPRGDGWRGRDESAEGRRRVQRLVAVLVALNAFDVVCTLTAAGQDGFRELNPLIVRHIEHPLIVVGFKVALVAVSASILVALRRHRYAQLAAWGAALFYTVAAFRWATFNSMLI